MELRPEQGGRGRGVAAVIEGFFGAMWFAWATSSAPGWLLPVLIAGAVAGLAVVVLGVVLARRSPSGSSPMADPAVRKRYNIIVAVEFGLIFAGAAVLGQVAEGYIAAWIALIVGLHFVPLGRVFAQRLLEAAGWVITAVAVVAAVVALATDGETSTVAGIGAGVTLVATGVLTFLGVRVFGDGQPVTER
ncbi:hypothetical protein [Cryptosporangium japonicum]|uniref:Integral membrane protein n=1 Tax=Cryptosporangium japonicum TaxID=80872 RepID=A0ABN0UTF8_9ACTN